jgi:hypothetical protein
MHQSHVGATGIRGLPGDIRLTSFFRAPRRMTV